MNKPVMGCPTAVIKHYRSILKPRCHMVDTARQIAKGTAIEFFFIYINVASPVRHS